MFDDFLTPISNLFGPTMMTTPEEVAILSPPADIEETDSNYFLSFDLPGVSPEDVKIEVRDNQLIVSGERKEEKQSDEGRQLNVERFYGRFQRVFALPTTIDPEKIDANFENGVLQVTIPKAEAAKPKMIQVKGSRGKRMLDMEKEGEEQGKEEKEAPEKAA